MHLVPDNRRYGHVISARCWQVTTTPATLSGYGTIVDHTASPSPCRKVGCSKDLVGWDEDEYQNMRFLLQSSAPMDPNTLYGKDWSGGVFVTFAGGRASERLSELSSAHERWSKGIEQIQEFHYMGAAEQSSSHKANSAL